MKKLIKSCLRWFGQVWRRLSEAKVKRIDQMENSPIARGNRDQEKI